MSQLVVRHHIHGLLAISFDDDEAARQYAKQARNQSVLNVKGDMGAGVPAILPVHSLADYAKLIDQPDLVKRIADAVKAQAKADLEYAKKKKLDEEARVHAAAEAERQRLIDERKAAILEERNAKIEAEALAQAQKEIDAIKATP